MVVSKIFAQLLKKRYTIDDARSIDFSKGWNDAILSEVFVVTEMGAIVNSHKLNHADYHCSCFSNFSSSGFNFLGRIFKIRRPAANFSLQAQFSATLEHPTYDLTSWKAGYSSSETEICQKVPMNLPEGLSGTFYRNHHGKFQIGETTIQHPFDADGLAVAATFVNNSVIFRNRIVRTEEFLKERENQKISYRGVFGVKLPGGWMNNIGRFKLKNPSNTNVIYYGNKLLSLWESGCPYELDPSTLSTKDRYCFKNMDESQGFTAHPKVDSKSGNLIAFSYTPGPLVTQLRLLEYNKNMNVLKDESVKLDGFAFFHDFAITENYFVFIQSSLDFNPLPFTLGVKTPAQCMSFNSARKAAMWLIPRDRMSKPIRKELSSPLLCLHLANAYEEGNKINVDMVTTDSLYLTNNPDASKPIWESIDIARDVPKSKLVTVKVSIADPIALSAFEYSQSHFEFPLVNPHFIGRKNRYVYGVTCPQSEVAGPFQTLVKIDRETNVAYAWNAGYNEFLSEPTFALKSNSKISDAEDDGFILLIKNNNNELTSEILAFNAANIVAGPISVIKLPIYIPYGLHGNFEPNLTFDFEEMKKKFDEYTEIDKLNK